MSAAISYIRKRQLLYVFHVGDCHARKLARNDREPEGDCRARKLARNDREPEWDCRARKLARNDREPEGDCHARKLARNDIRNFTRHCEERSDAAISYIEKKFTKTRKEQAHKSLLFFGAQYGVCFPKKTQNFHKPLKIACVRGNCMIQLY